MKKIISLFFLAAMSMSISGCNKKAETPPPPPPPPPVAEKPANNQNPHAASWGWKAEPAPNPENYKNKF